MEIKMPDDRVLCCECGTIYKEGERHACATRSNAARQLESKMEPKQEQLVIVRTGRYIYKYMLMGSGTTNEVDYVHKAELDEIGRLMDKLEIVKDV